MAFDYGAVIDNALGTDFFPDGETFDPTKRTLKSTTSFARVVVYHYVNQNFGDAISVKLSNGIVPGQSSVLQIDKHVIEAEVSTISLSKDIGSAVGNFNFELMPTKNWKSVISPGDWIVIYLYNNQNDFGDSAAFIDDVKNGIAPNQNIAMFGNVGRVSRTKQKDKTDKTIVRYRVGGQDFGKIFNSTDIWFNPYKVESLPGVLQSLMLAKGLKFTGNPNSIVGDIMDVFLGANGGNTDAGVTDPLKQWQVPPDLVSIFDRSNTLDKNLGDNIRSRLLKSSSFNTDQIHDVLKKNFHPSMPGYKPNKMLNPKSNGSLWSMMKGASNDVVNELFSDLSRDGDGKVAPAVFLRPRPNSAFFSDSPGKLNEAFYSLQDLARKKAIIISPVDIIFEDIGRDDQVRTNMIWLDSTQSLAQNVNAYGNAFASLHGGNGLPMVQQESMNRYGLRKFETRLDYVYSNGKAGSANVDGELFASFIGQLYDQKAYSHLYETGTLETPGKINAELGSVLRIKSEKGVGDKDDGKSDRLFYIQGYNHEWTFPGIWTTQFTLTMGQWNDEERPFIDISKNDFGKIDTISETVTLAQTVVNRGVGQGVSTKDISGTGKYLKELFGL